MFEFVFTQMTNTQKTNTHSYKKFDSSMIFIIIGGCPDKFQDIVFKSTKATNILNIMVNIVSPNNSWGKKRIFEKVMFCFEKGYVFSFPSGVRGLS